MLTRGLKGLGSDWDQVFVELSLPVGVFALACGAVGGGRVQETEQGSEKSQE